MPNLIPQSVLGRFVGWAHPAGRLIFASLIFTFTLIFAAALLRPPLERKLLTAKQAVVAGIVLLILCILLAKYAPSLDVFAVWLLIFGLFAVILAAVVSRDPRDPERKATWSESMAGAVAVFFMMTLGYAVIPSEWITFSDKYLRWTSDKFIVETYAIKPNYQQLRDVIVIVIYVVMLGLTLLLWSAWQKRLQVRPEAAAGEAPVRTSRFGRPLKSKA